MNRTLPSRGRCALVICNGEMPKKSEALRLAAEARFIVCVDGGANRARRLHIHPHLIVGDLDSVTPGTRRALATVPMMRIDDQETTDLEKALNVLLARKYRHAIVVGATGRRPDHTIANYSILRKYGGRIRLRYVDRYCDIFLVTDAMTFEARIGQTISLSPLGRCGGITTEGLKYPLKNETLELGVREGESNEVVSLPVTVRVKRGALLLFIVKRR